MSLGYKHVGKRVVDVAIALPLCVLASFVLAPCVAYLFLFEKGVVFYRQQRVGRFGKPFTLIKLRSLTEQPRDVSIQITGHNNEGSLFGRFLRRSKIDELPQLFQVLSGTLSLVGPRPALPQVLNLEDPLCKRRIEVRPGLTGLAQVNGNAILSWEERWKLDARYVDECTFALDLKILAKTALIVLLGDSFGLPFNAEKRS